MSNPSQIVPVEFKVLLKMDDVMESDPTLKRLAASGLAIPADLRQKEQMGGQRGVLVAVGGGAFNDWPGRVPKEGERVYTARYPGFEVEGADGVKYRLANDKEIVAVIEA